MFRNNYDNVITTMSSMKGTSGPYQLDKCELIEWNRSGLRFQITMDLST